MNKEKISYIGMKVSVGIDVHRKFFVLSGVSEGVLLKRCRVDPRGELVVGFIGKYFSGATVRTCYESGYSGFWLHRYLERAGISNIVVHAASVEVEAGNRVKTDKRDSRKLAEQLDANRLRGIRIPSEEEEHRRLVTRTREQLSGAKRRVQAQIRMKLHQLGMFPEGYDKALQPALVHKIMAERISAELKLSLEVLLSQWEHLKADIKKLDKVLAKQSEGDECEAVYRSAPGVGPLTARVLANELGDMSQFKNVRALYSFTGLTPGEYSSGGTTHRGHISRQGSSRLRHMLVEAAWTAIRMDKKLAEDFSRIAARRGKKIAIVAIARKLIGKIRATFLGKKSYELEHKLAA